MLPKVCVHQNLIIPTCLHKVLAVDHHRKHSAALRELRGGRKLLATVALYQLVLRLVTRTLQGSQGLLVVHGRVVVQQRGQQALQRQKIQVKRILV